MPRTKLVHWLLVAGQFTFSAWIILGGGWPLGRGLPMLLATIGFLVAGLAVWTMGLRQITTMPTPRPGALLIQRGPYRWIRHPMYIGLLLFCTGFVIAEPSVLRGLMLVALMVILHAKTIHEERALQTSVNGYREYQSRTKKFVPFVW